MKGVRYRSRSVSNGMDTKKNLPKPDPELEKPQKDLPLPEKDLPLPEIELTAHSSKGRMFRSMKLTTLLILLLLLGAIIILAAFAGNKYLDQKNLATITDFESCVAAGNPVMESYPEQCASEGQTFTRILSEEEQDKLNPDPTAEWDIHRGESFSFMYPYTYDYLDGYFYSDNTGDPYWRNQKVIAIHESTTSSTEIKECIYKDKDFDEGIKYDIQTRKKTSSRSILIDGQQAIQEKIETLFAYDSEEGGDGTLHVTNYCYVRDGKIVTLAFYNLEEPPDETEQSIMDQIISSFQFTSYVENDPSDQGFYYSPDGSRRIYIEYKQVKDQEPAHKFHIADADGENDTVFHEVSPYELEYDSQAYTKLGTQLWSPNSKYFYLETAAPVSTNQILIFKNDGTKFRSGEQSIQLNKLLENEEGLGLQDVTWNSDSQMKITTYHPDIDNTNDYLFDINIEELIKLTE